jgi:hypothetical protein
MRCWLCRSLVSDFGWDVAFSRGFLVLVVVRCAAVMVLAKSLSKISPFTFFVCLSIVIKPSVLYPCFFYFFVHRVLSELSKDSTY